MQIQTAIRPAENRNNQKLRHICQRRILFLIRKRGMDIFVDPKVVGVDARGGWHAACGAGATRANKAK